MVTCPKCDSALDLEEDELDEGDEFTCDECAATLRVTSTGPLELEVADDGSDDDEDDELDEDEEYDEEEEADEEAEEEEAEDDDAEWR